MPVNDTASLGSINHTKEARLRLAEESINFVCPKCGPIKDICARMMAVEEKSKVDKEEVKVKEENAKIEEVPKVEDEKQKEIIKEDKPKEDKPKEELTLKEEEKDVKVEEKKEELIKEEVKEDVVPEEVKKGVASEEKKEEQPLPKKKTVKRELSEAAKVRIRKALNKEVDKRLNVSIFLLVVLFLLCIKDDLINLILNVSNMIMT